MNAEVPLHPDSVVRGRGGRAFGTMLIAPTLLASLFASHPARAESIAQASAPEARPPAIVDPEAAQREEQVLRLGMGGAMAFANTYTVTVVVATGALLLCWNDPDGEHCGLPDARSAWYELYIPVAGPFVTLRHEDVRSNWKYAVPFIGSGVVQSVGAGLALMSLLWPKQEVSAALARVSLVATGETLGFALHGNF